MHLPAHVAECVLKQHQVHGAAPRLQPIVLQLLCQQLLESHHVTYGLVRGRINTLHVCTGMGTACLCLPYVMYSAETYMHGARDMTVCYAERSNCQVLTGFMNVTNGGTCSPNASKSWLKEVENSADSFSSCCLRSHSRSAASHLHDAWHSTHACSP